MISNFFINRIRFALVISILISIVGVIALDAVFAVCADALGI